MFRFHADEVASRTSWRVTKHHWEGLEQLIDAIQSSNVLLAIHHPLDFGHFLEIVGALAELDLLSATAGTKAILIQRHNRFFACRSSLSIVPVSNSVLSRRYQTDQCTTHIGISADGMGWRLGANCHPFSWFLRVICHPTNKKDRAWYSVLLGSAFSMFLRYQRHREMESVPSFLSCLASHAMASFACSYPALLAIASIARSLLAFLLPQLFQPTW